MSSDGSRYPGVTGSAPAPASAAPTDGSNGAATTWGVKRTGAESEPPAPVPSSDPDSAGAMAIVCPP
nr:hypothetical protein CPGR_02169 [Mycolicibacterium komanii]